MKEMDKGIISDVLHIARNLIVYQNLEKGKKQTLSTISKVRFEQPTLLFVKAYGLKYNSSLQTFKNI